MENQVFIDRWLKLAIASLPKLSQKLIGVGKPYEPLLLEFLKLDPDSNERFLTDKSIIREAGDQTTFFPKMEASGIL